MTAHPHLASGRSRWIPRLGHVLLVHGIDWWEVVDGHRYLIGSAGAARALADTWVKVGQWCTCIDPHHTVARVDTTTLQGYPLTPDHEWACPVCGATTRARMADRLPPA